MDFVSDDCFPTGLTVALLMIRSGCDQAKQLAKHLTYINTFKMFKQFYN